MGPYADAEVYFAALCIVKDFLTNFESHVSKSNRVLLCSIYYARQEQFVCRIWEFLMTAFQHTTKILYRDIDVWPTFQTIFTIVESQ